MTKNSNQGGGPALTYIRPIPEYASTAWGNLGTTQVNRLERFQRRAAKIILRRPLFVPQ